MRAMVTFNNGEGVFARFELGAGMACPSTGQWVLIRSRMYEVTRVVLDFTPQDPNVQQLVMCKVRPAGPARGKGQGV